MVNLLPLKTGGGVQVALDFLRQAAMYGVNHEWFIVVRKDSQFLNVELSDNMQIVYSVPDNLLARLYFEYFGCKSLIQQYEVDAVYTQFGPHWPGSGVLNIAGCAYSNLFYPELDFWGKLPIFKKLLKKIIDSQRLKRILSADVRIFETEDLAQRAIGQYGLDPDTVTFVRAAVSSLVSEEMVHESTAEKCENLPAGYKILLLSGYHPNKNIEFLVDVAEVLKEQKVDNIRFVLTLPEDIPSTRNLLHRAGQLGVASYIYNFGPVPQEGCCELYRSCDAAVLPSTLESFSNMIAESWAMKRPLMISDLSWCRSLCGDGALYYKYLDAYSMAEVIKKLMVDVSVKQFTIEQGDKELQKYPTSRDRFLSYLAIIEKSVRAKQVSV